MSGQVYERQLVRTDKKDRSNSSLGKAKRSDTFALTLEQRDKYAKTPLMRIDLDRAAMQGTPDLAPGPRCLLGYYLSFLSIEKLLVGHTCVWPRAALSEHALGISGATLRRHKAQLEDAGYIIRQYDQRNRPLEEGGIDLAPFLNQVPTIISSIDTHLAARRAMYQEQRANADIILLHNTQTPGQSYPGTQPIKTERQNNNHKPFQYCTVLDEKNEQSENTNPKIRPALDGNHGCPTEIRKSLNLSSQLKGCFSENVPPDNWQALPQPVIERLSDLFGNDSLQNFARIWAWCVKRHGAGGAVIRLVVSLEDPNIKNRVRFFGWLATTSEDIDLTPNIARIKSKQAKLPPSELNLPEDAFGLKISKKIANHLSVASFNAWFAPTKAKFKQEKGYLVIKTSSGWATNEIKNRYGEILERVVSAAHLTDVKFEPHWTP